MESRNCKDIEIKHPISDVQIAKIVDNEHTVVVHMTLGPDQGLKPHVTPVDVKFLVIEGEVTILIGEDQQTFSAGAIVDSPKNIIHNVSNNSKSVAKLLVIKTPNPSNSK